MAEDFDRLKAQKDNIELKQRDVEVQRLESELNEARKRLEIGQRPEPPSAAEWRDWCRWWMGK